MYLESCCKKNILCVCTLIYADEGFNVDRMWPNHMASNLIAPSLRELLRTHTVCKVYMVMIVSLP